LKSIAVIGAAGFVGSRLVESCLLKGVKGICAVVRGPRNLGKLCRLGSALKVKMADAENVDVLSDAIKGCSTVVNVTMSHDPMKIIKSTKAIHLACVAAGAKHFIHLSSAVVYGQVESPMINDDSPPLAKHWMPYARAKSDSELFLREVSGLSPVEITVLRPGIVWGPRSTWSLNAAQDLIYNKAYLVDDGAGVCNSIYIDNLISCILTCCSRKTDASGFFNVSDAEFVTWRDFYESLAGYLRYDMAKIPKVSSDHFRPSLNSFLNDVKLHHIYIKIKEKIPEDTRALVKFWLGGKFISHKKYNKRGKGGMKLQVTRDMWHLQTVRHKLPNEKFSKRFNYAPPVSFHKGTRLTINWLKFIGI